MEMPATVDRISDLQDELLCHILSFLPTKLAYATSVLSKRWTPLCHSLTALRFDDEAVRDVHGFLRFRGFVDAVTLSPRVQHQPIETFHLEVRGSPLWGAGLSNVTAWVEAAKRRRVENLEVSMKCMSLILLAPSIFSCRTLVVLKLTKVHVMDNLGSSDLPSLKTLHLREVYFEKREDLKKLLSACPVLEDLHTTTVDILDGHVTPSGYKTLSKLVRADIGTYQVPFRALYNVEFLRISGLEVTFPTEDVNSYYKGFPVFPNLIHVELWSVQFLYGFHGWGFYGFHGWGAVVEVLQHCPKLQILLVEKPKLDRSLYVCKEEDWTYPDSVPECVSSHLRRCSIVNFAGIEGDLRFAKYILQNARLLQVMTIRSTGSSNPMGKPQFLEELSSRISPACTLQFESI